MSGIQRLIDAGLAEVLEGAGWQKPFTDAPGSEWTYTGRVLDTKIICTPAGATAVHEELAGMAALSWLIKGEHILSEGYSPKVDKFLILIKGPVTIHEAPTLAEASIDAAIAVYEQEKKS